MIDIDRIKGKLGMRNALLNKAKAGYKKDNPGDSSEKKDNPDNDEKDNNNNSERPSLFDKKKKKKEEKEDVKKSLVDQLNNTASDLEEMNKAVATKYIKRVKKGGKWVYTYKEGQGPKGSTAKPTGGMGRVQAIEKEAKELNSKMQSLPQPDYSKSPSGLFGDLPESEKSKDKAISDVRYKMDQLQQEYRTLKTQEGYKKSEGARVSANKKPDVGIKSMADFKKNVAPGKKLTMIYHAHDPQGAVIGKEREIGQVKSNAITLKTKRSDGKEVESYLYLPKSSDVKFEKNVMDVYQNDKLLMSYDISGLKGEGSSGSEKKFVNVQYNVGRKGNYIVNFHDGEKTHKDGSPFFDMRIFRNKKEFEKFQKQLKEEGYKTGGSQEAMKAHATGKK